MFVFFFNDTATTEIYTLSLHDALPISARAKAVPGVKHVVQISTGIAVVADGYWSAKKGRDALAVTRSEEHTSELQSQSNLVCRLLLEKKKKATHAVPECVAGAELHTEF